MPNKKISELDTIASPVSADYIPLVEEGVTKKATLASLPISTATQTALNLKAAKASNLSDLADPATARANLGLGTGGSTGSRNKIINGNFGVNQRAVSGSVSLAAGAYGHDRWKAGASGCSYTFSTTDNITTLTISAGSLQQVLDGANLQSGTYVMSWTGTSQGKIGAGSYSTSGVTGTATGGTNLTVEFGTGTLSLVQLEPGSSATQFEHRAYGTELMLCQRYYEKSYNQGTSPGAVTTNGSHNSSQSTSYLLSSPSVRFAVTKRSTPTIVLYDTTTGGTGQGTEYDTGSIVVAVRAASASAIGETGFEISGTAGNFTGSGSFLRTHWAASAEL